MKTVETLTILVSGPSHVSLTKPLQKWLSEKNMTKVLLQRVRARAAMEPASACTVDILRIFCPAQKTVVAKVVGGLKHVRDKVCRREKCHLWLLVPGTLAIPLEAQDAASRLLVLNRSRKRTARTDRRTEEELAQLSVIPYGGEHGIQLLSEKRAAGCTLSEATQDVIDSSNPLEYFEEVTFAF